MIKYFETLTFVAKILRNSNKKKRLNIPLNLVTQPIYISICLCFLHNFLHTYVFLSIVIYCFLTNLQRKKFNKSNLCTFNNNISKVGRIFTIILLYWKKNYEYSSFRGDPVWVLKRYIDFVSYRFLALFWLCVLTLVKFRQSVQTSNVI